MQEDRGLLFVVFKCCRRRLVRCRLVRMSVSSLRVDFFFFFVPAKAAVLDMTYFLSVSTSSVITNAG